MNLNLDEALKYFNKIPKKLQVVSLDPNYIYIDSLRNINLNNFFCVYKKDENFSLNYFHLVKDNLCKTQDLISSYNYGQTIHSTNDRDFIYESSICFRDWCLKKGIILKLSKIHPFINNVPNNENEVIYYNRDTVFIDLKQDLFSSYQARSRTAIRKAKKMDMKISTENDFKAISKIYYENMRSVNAKKFYFFNETYFEKLLNYDKSICFSAALNNKIIAFVLILFSDNAKIAEYHLGSSNAEGKSFNVNKLLLHEAASFFKKKNYDTFFLGGGRTHHQNDKLLHFKKLFSKKIKKFYVSYEIFDKLKYKKLSDISKPSKKSGIIFYRPEV